MKDDQKNFLLFAVIAGLLLFAWPAMTGWLFPTPPATTVTKAPDGAPKVVPNPDADPAADTPAAIRDRNTVLRETPRIAIETPTVRGSLNLKGARIDDLVLVKHKETIAKDSDPIRLLSPSGTRDAYFAGFGWSGQGLNAPGSDTVWQASGTRLTPTTPVTLTTTSGTQRFAIELSVDDGYMFTVRQKVVNLGQTAIAAAGYGYLHRYGPGKDHDTWTIHAGPVASYNGIVDYDVNYDTVAEPGAQTKFATKGGWIGYTDIYWLTALVPDQGLPVDLQFRPGAGTATQAQFAPTTARQVGPGQVMTQTTRFFAGAKDVNLLDQYEEEGGIHLFGKAIDWGWFEVFEKPIFHYLHWLFRMIGNFGLAIIALTLTVRLLLFPIAQKQFASMASMRALQPKMKALQERFKDDKPRQQQEIMKLYKDEKVNPLAGCLPTLLQIPILYALYKVLMLSIEMRHQPFVGWIRDLSAPDPANFVNLVHYLSGIQLPMFLAIGALPILLGVSMWAQFKLNPAPMDDIQKQMFAIMPWVLMFVMAPFAAGLQLYWITSNLLTIAQQKFLYSRHPALKEPVPASAAVIDAKPGKGEEVTEFDPELIEGARKTFAGPVAFLKSAPALQFLPDATVPEVAFAGRSNVGKSSLLNALTGRNALARTSNTPGRTQELNFFDIGDPLRFRLVDMPGYGFAKAPKDVVRKWRFLVNDYLRGRDVLKRVLVLIDSRHGIKDVDREILDMLDAAAVSYRIVLTKGDKIKPAELADVTDRTIAEARKRPAAHPDILATSSEKNDGIAELRAAVIEAVSV